MRPALIERLLPQESGGELGPLIQQQQLAGFGEGNAHQRLAVLRRERGERCGRFRLGNLRPGGLGRQAPGCSRRGARPDGRGFRLGKPRAADRRPIRVELSGAQGKLALQEGQRRAARQRAERRFHRSAQKALGTLGTQPTLLQRQARLDFGDLRGHPLGVAPLEDLDILHQLPLPCRFSFRGGLVGGAQRAVRLLAGVLENLAVERFGRS